MASHRCDLPGCTRIRARWQRLCSPCFEALPRDLRNRMITARRLGHMSDWRGACKRAAQSRRALVLAGRLTDWPSLSWR